MGKVQSDLRIRLGLKEDQPDLERIAAEAYRQYIPVMGKKPAPMLADYASHLAHDTVYVAKVGKATIGYAITISKSMAGGLKTSLLTQTMPGRGWGLR